MFHRSSKQLIYKPVFVTLPCYSQHQCRIKLILQKFFYNKILFFPHSQILKEFINNSLKCCMAFAVSSFHHSGTNRNFFRVCEITLSMHRFLDEFILYEFQNKYFPRTPMVKLCPIALGLQDLNYLWGLLHERKSGTR